MITPAAREETIFHIARQLTHPQDRTAYLDDVCGEDKELRERVERLLDAEQPADEFFQNSPPELKPLPPSPNEPSQGDVLGDYEIMEKIGGNMGLVFKARHRLLDKVVALKLLPADSMIDPARLARFQRELRTMALLNHPNLVTARDARIVGGWHMVAMEFIDGMDLQRVVETRGELPVAEACEVLRQAALGLQCAHEHGLVHRDIKPSNLMVTRSGLIKVIDMGLALVAHESAVRVTKDGMVLGTMRYCAPEQYRDASSVDIRADIYSLGCTLYHFLAGQPPYWQRTTWHEVIQAHLHEPFPALREARTDAPEEIETVITRMTAKNPEERFATPSELAEALEPFAREADLKPLVMASTGRATPGRASTPQPSPSPQTARPAGGGRKPSKVLWICIAAMLVLLLAVVGALFLAKNPVAPVVVLMDTTAKRGIYDEENRDKGISNTEVLKNKVLGELSLRVYPLNISIDAFELQWRGENYVIALQPDLVIIHRSVFFHPLNAVLDLGYPEQFTNNPAALMKWETLYGAIDDKLITFMANVRSASPRTKFLVYSTGTDKRWMDEDFRKQWTEHIGARFPALKGQVRTMEIQRRPDGTRGTFQDADTAEDMRNRVKTILGLSDP